MLSSKLKNASVWVTAVIWFKLNLKQNFSNSVAWNFIAVEYSIATFSTLTPCRIISSHLVKWKFTKDKKKCFWLNKSISVKNAKRIKWIILKMCTSLLSFQGTLAVWIGQIEKTYAFFSRKIDFFTIKILQERTINRIRELRDFYFFLPVLFPMILCTRNWTYFCNNIK